jgi:hypothetical protein
MNEDQRSYAAGYVTTVTSGGVPSPNPGCPMHAWWLVVDHQSGEG